MIQRWEEAADLDEPEKLKLVLGAWQGMKASNPASADLGMNKHDLTESAQVQILMEDICTDVDEAPTHINVAEAELISKDLDRS